MNQMYRPLDLMKDSKITKFELDDFIGVWENFVTESFCDNLIQFFESKIINEDYVQYIDPKINGLIETKKMFGEEMYGSSLVRKDTSILLNYISDSYTEQVNKILMSCVSHYVHNFPQLSECPLSSFHIKFQKTSIGEGYHLWHYENSSVESACRELVWTIYLNDVPDGEGETEFLYQHRRSKPTKGTVVILPAGMTHVHRGNTMLTSDKYILTGWYVKDTYIKS